jgi:hypothetical protein
VIRRRVPAEVRARADGRRILAWAHTADGYLVATAEDLMLPDGGGVGWDAVVRAAWEPPVLQIVLPAGPRRFTLDEPRGIPDAVNERVTASVVVQDHIPLRGDKGIRVLARRVPGGSDVTWRVTFDAGLDPADPQLRGDAEDALARLRTSIGL